MLQESMSWKAGYVSEHATGVNRNKVGSEHATLANGKHATFPNMLQESMENRLRF